jgi:sirohydrochlorin cobaltochelatase
MLRIAARLRANNAVPFAKAAFLNYSRPQLADVVEQCVRQGATEIWVQPYFLIAGTYVRRDVHALLQQLREVFPTHRLHQLPPFGFHHLLADIVQARAEALPADLGDRRRALLLVAHGTPDPSDNQPIHQVAAQISEQGSFATVAVGYLACNQPDIPSAIQALAEQYAEVILVPYFLHAGRHVTHDLPMIVAAARQEHPACRIRLTPHLGYDQRLTALIAERYSARQ